MKLLITLIFLFLTSINTSYSQPSDKALDPKQVDCKLIEHFTKQLIDSVRVSRHLKPLQNDEIPYKAALDQAEYLTNKTGISHNQKSKSKKTPADRIKYYKGNYQMTGENVVRSYIFENVKDEKSGKIFTNNTYQQIARHLVRLWVNSPGHFANIVTKDYNLTGMAVTHNPKTNAITGVQVFAKAGSTYKVVSDKATFPYEGKD